MAKKLSPKDLHSFAQIAWSLAEAGGIILKKFWGNLARIDEKGGAGDIVTEADKQAEKEILSLLKKECPHHAILAEESGTHAGEQSDFLWLIDPIDGTVNYAHQYPYVSVSIALLFCGQPMVGVVFNPILNELFQATAGMGATLNGSSIKTSEIKTVSKSLLASGFPYDRNQTSDNNYAEFCHLTSLTQGVRRAGSAALDLAYVAAGRFDGYWERGIKPWDVAAGALLVLEAGGKVSGYDGGALDLTKVERILATNGHLHQALSNELVKIKKQIKV